MASLAPSPYMTEVPVEGKWSTGLYDCCEDRDICFRTSLCPWETMGEIAEIVDSGTTTKQDACWHYACSTGECRAIYAGGYRAKLREMFKLPEEPYSDCCAHYHCYLCALTQEYRELKNRGADPSLGWQGNVEKWNREGIQEPPIPTRMARG